MTNQELSKIAQAAAYMDVLVNAEIIDKETEDFCIDNIKQILDELLKEGNKTQTITAPPLYRGLDITTSPAYIDSTTGSYPELTTISHPVICKGENYGVYQPL